MTALLWTLSALLLWLLLRPRKCPHCGSRDTASCRRDRHQTTGDNLCRKCMRVFDSLPLR